MKKFLCILLALFMLMGVAACNKTDDPANGDGENGEQGGDTTPTETIKIGINYELSGGVATYGQILSGICRHGCGRDQRGRRHRRQDG